MRSSGSPERGSGPASPQARRTAGPGYPGLPVQAFLDALAAASPAPAAGSAAALVLAQAAALCAKSARLSARQVGEERAAELTDAAERVRAAATALTDADAAAYQEVVAAMRAGRAAPAADGGGGRSPGVAAALSRAADVPMEVVVLAAELSGPAAALATAGNPNLRGDAQTAALLSQAAARSAARLVTINLADAHTDPRPARAARLLARIDVLVAESAAHP